VLSRAPATDVAERRGATLTLAVSIRAPVSGSSTFGPAARGLVPRLQPVHPARPDTITGRG
jgi:hypothetical protein